MSDQLATRISAAVRKTRPNGAVPSTEGRKARNRRQAAAAHPFRRGGQDLAGKLGIALGVLAVSVLAAVTWTQYDAAVVGLRSSAFGRALVWIGWGLVAVNLAALLWRIVLVLRYRPLPVCSNAALPRCTVVVPAYNEGRLVLETLRSIAASNYPPGKLSIVAVDDGSKDDTWRWIRQGAAEFPAMVRAIRQPANGGKRRALYEGFKHAVGDVLVTIDSDSTVQPDTIRRLVSPFVRDGRIGAVAGNVRILNRREGLIPRMLDVSFAYSFDFMRASQSEVHTVMCTPGALSAYRRDVVMEVLPEWLNQRFCGRLATIGEDRALTNMILRRGYNAHFQRDAMVYTKVPTRYRGLCKMFLRWARSNVRETWVMSHFLFGRFRTTPALGARINLLVHWLGMTLGQLTKLVALAYVLWLPHVFGVRLLFGAAVTACVPAAFYAIRHRSTNALWAFLYSIFWVFGLSWIGTYAILTMYKTGWLTRDLPAGVPAATPAGLPHSVPPKAATEAA